MYKESVLFIQLLSLTLVSCGSRRPCAEGGDTSWPSKIHGDKTCHQKKNKDGKYVNHGKFTQKYKNGKIALEGAFADGEKSGYWIQYDPTGKKIVEKYFENGVEKSPPALPVEARDPKKK